MRTRKRAVACIATLAGAVALTSALPAMAQSGGAGKPMGKMTCDEFLKVEEVAKPKYVYFATAYAKGGKPEDAIVDIIYTDRLVPIIVKDCQRNLNASYYERVRRQYTQDMKGESRK